MTKKEVKKTCQLCQAKVSDLITDTGYSICQKCNDKITSRIVKKVKPSKVVKPSKAVKVSKEEMLENKEASDKKIKKLRKDKKKKERKVYSTVYLLGTEKEINKNAKKAEKKLERRTKRLERISNRIVKAQERLLKLEEKKKITEAKYPQAKPITIQNKEYVEKLKEMKTFEVENKKSSSDKIKLYGVKSDGSRVIKVGDTWFQDVGITLKDEDKNFPAQAGKVSERKMKRKILRALQEK